MNCLTEEHRYQNFSLPERKSVIAAKAVICIVNCEFPPAWGLQIEVEYRGTNPESE